MRWGATAAVALVAGATVASYAVCVRLVQRATVLPDGSIVWRQLALHAGGTSDLTSFPFPPPSPTPLPIVEWVGFGGVPATAAPSTAGATVTSGTPLLLLLPTAVAAALWASHLRRQREAQRHACSVCRYDLRGLPAGAPCPECGARRAG
ncbi:MAG TPA: hypothetical protein VEB22_12730 [Phycisphaerales bacterium]|nr:hypothetical protein [Phycisphaerales bacterium]